MDVSLPLEQGHLSDPKPQRNWGFRCFEATDSHHKTDCLYNLILPAVKM